MNFMFSHATEIILGKASKKSLTPKTCEVSSLACRL